MSEICDSLNGGIELGCLNNIGGVRWIAFAEKKNVASLVKGSPLDIITAINMTGSPANVFYKFEFNKNTSSYTEDMPEDQASGRALNTITINLVLNRREKAKRDRIMTMYKKDLVAIIYDNNGLYWYAGEENGLNIATNGGGSGTSKTDVNQYVITLIGEEPALMNEITESAVNLVLE